MSDGSYGQPCRDMFDLSDSDSVEVATMAPMSARKKDESSVYYGDSHFDSTEWSVVLAAGHPSSPESGEALSHLCQRYWYPLYAYARRRVFTSDDAQELTQEFFAQLLERNALAVADPDRGRFRCFLLTAFKHFLANEWKKRKTQKRGGGRMPFSLDFDSGESRYGLEPSDDETPEHLYDKQWAKTLVHHVMERLRDEFKRAGKEHHLKQLSVFLSGASHSYADAARELGMTEGAAKVAAHRLRRRYRELLRAEIAKTVSGPDEIDEEIRSLFTALG